VNALQTILLQPFINVLGWTLLHSLWQGTLVALLLLGIQRCCQPYRANTRYLLASVALVIMLILPIITIYRISLTDSTQSKEVAANNLTERQELRSVTGINIRIGDNQGAPESSTLIEQQIKFGMFQSLPAILTICWLMGVFLLSLRLLIGLNQTKKISNHNRQPVAEHWQVMLKGLAQRLNIAKPVAIFQSVIVEVPTVIGWLRPIILLPPSALIGLTPEQLELILAHELAHIRRYDYFVNLLQTVIETLLFYHPAVWWVSHQIRLEREQACDDLVLEICGHPLVYARALTKLERLRQTNPKLAMTANGGSLMKRINRILEVSDSNYHSSRKSTTFLAASTTILMAILSLYFSIEAIPLEKSTEKSTAKNTVIFPPATTKEVKLTSRPLANKTDKTAQLITKDSTAGEDTEVRQIAINALGKHEGTIIVMDAQTGRIHTIVNQEWALRRSWNSASTIKLVTGLAGVSENIIDPKEKITTSKKSTIDFAHALAESNNEYFKSLGSWVGSEKIIHYAHQFGFGQVTGINLEGEISGQLPDKNTEIEGGSLGAYSQGIAIPPIQLATFMAALANGGNLLVPYTTPEAQYQTQIRRHLNIAPQALSNVIEGMTLAVKEGTAISAYDPQLPIAGKTGTTDGKTVGTGLFISFAPVNNPRLVVVVAIEGKDVRGAIAAQIAGTIYQGLRNRF